MTRWKNIFNNTPPPRTDCLASATWKGIRYLSPTLVDGEIILSYADAVTKALEAYKRKKMTPALFARDMSVSEPYALKYIKNIILQV